MTNLTYPEKKKKKKCFSRTKYKDIYIVIIVFIPFFRTLSYRTKSSAITAAWCVVSVGITVDVKPAATAPVE